MMSMEINHEYTKIKRMMIIFINVSIDVITYRAIFRQVVSPVARNCSSVRFELRKENEVL